MTLTCVQPAREARAERQARRHAHIDDIWTLSPNPTPPNPPPPFGGGGLRTLPQLGMLLWGARWKEAGARYLQGAGRARAMPSKARAPVRCHDVSVGQRLVRVSLLGAGSPGLGSVWLPRVVASVARRVVGMLYRRVVGQS